MTEYIYWQDDSGLYKREEIVRCRDCQYNARDVDGICYRSDHEHFNQPDGFCKWGERKTDELEHR